ncbi:UDP-4-amino-4,6-dideoxy-N-acetyl-beta-L-altrosamine transaminase [Oceanospirillum sp. D5]|uniref:UDP-4-amino-4, 6-dideoxy-N-acetyl-beta-L-altrosamine transaminase n=2 Tax=Oceanospirillum sediminis TaxID=2760088 RepID=A0A839IKD3_9GAMM|nr:UDP-4-amino-4,6-dideoxy-N-acetyl-beta-L-altrosamine transaminase [Oceanospirillum sediminis]
MIPYGRQNISEQDIQAVIDVLRSDFLTQGQCVPEFERRLAGYCGAGYGIAVNSATSALHLACLALGLSEGMRLWTSPVTFVASANCALYCQAAVDFVDVDPSTYNIDVKCLKNKLEKAKAKGCLPDVLVAVHMAGLSCDMKVIYELSLKYGFRIIEDASHAVGGRYLSEPVGSCRYSDITIFSFHPVKIVTTAEGGMAMTNDAELAHKMALLRSHGITREPALMTSEPDGAWYYQQIELGFNYRMTELQAALGLSQLERLDAFVMQRQQIADRYDALLAGLPVFRPGRSLISESAWHLYVIRLDSAKTAVSRKNVFDYMRSKGVGVNVHYIPVHTQPYYQALGFRMGAYPEAEACYEGIISLPLFPDLTESQQDYVVEVLQEALVL